MPEEISNTPNPSTQKVGSTEQNAEAAVPTINDPSVPQPVPEPSKPKVNKRLVMIIAAILLLLVAGGIAAYFLVFKNQTAQPSPLGSPEPTAEAADPTADWKTYEGKYFTFKYPSSWNYDTNAYSVDPDNLEVINLRISPNAVFETSYKNRDYDEFLKGLADRKSTKLIVASRDSAKFEVDSNGNEPLPAGFSIISIVVKGPANTSYLINFNGDKKEITDELVDQILSTFRFIDNATTD